MEVLGIRFCAVSEEASAQADFFDALGLTKRHIPAPPVGNDVDNADAAAPFSGAIFAAGNSWVELWQSSEEMPAGYMLHVVVDDADAFAAYAQQHGLHPRGPMDAHGERIYFLEAPGGLPVALLSAL